MSVHDAKGFSLKAVEHTARQKTKGQNVTNWEYKIMKRD